MNTFVATPLVLAEMEEEDLVNGAGGYGGDDDVEMHDADGSQDDDDIFSALERALAGK